MLEQKSVFSHHSIDTTLAEYVNHCLSYIMRGQTAQARLAMDKLQNLSAGDPEKQQKIGEFLRQRILRAIASGELSVWDVPTDVETPIVKEGSAQAAMAHVSAASAESRVKAIGKMIETVLDKSPLAINQRKHARALEELKHINSSFLGNDFLSHDIQLKMQTFLVGKQGQAIRDFKAGFAVIVKLAETSSDLSPYVHADNILNTLTEESLEKILKFRAAWLDICRQYYPVDSKFRSTFDSLTIKPTQWLLKYPLMFRELEEIEGNLAKINPALVSSDKNLPTASALREKVSAIAKVFDTQQENIALKRVKKMEIYKEKLPMLERGWGLSSRISTSTINRGIKSLKSKLDKFITAERDKKTLSAEENVAIHEMLLKNLQRLMMKIHGKIGKSLDPYEIKALQSMIEMLPTLCYFYWETHGSEAQYGKMMDVIANTLEKVITSKTLPVNVKQSAYRCAERLALPSHKKPLINELLKKYPMVDQNQIALTEAVIRQAYEENMAKIQERKQASLVEEKPRFIQRVISAEVSFVDRPSLWKRVKAKIFNHRQKKNTVPLSTSNKMMNSKKSSVFGIKNRV